MIFKAEDRCKFCANYLNEQTCKAFPEKIPEAIWSGEDFHDHPIEGDQGITYQSRHLHFPLID
jgi:hypothetical protein